MNSTTRRLVVLMFIVGGLTVCRVSSGNSTGNEETLSYGELRKQVEARQVKAAVVEEGTGIKGQLVNGASFRTEVSNHEIQAELAKAMSDAGVSVSFKTAPSRQLGPISYALILILAGLAAVISIRRMMAGDKRLSFGKFTKRSNSALLSYGQGAIDVLRIFAWLNLLAGAIAAISTWSTASERGPGDIILGFGFLAGGICGCAFLLVVCSTAENLIAIRKKNETREMSDG
jgi:hypothetical protein